ncbi:MAG: hypothetical protein ACTIA6_10355 [Pseudoclavibacter sp.]
MDLRTRLAMTSLTAGAIVMIASGCTDTETVDGTTTPPSPVETTSAPTVPTAGPNEQEAPPPEVGSAEAISVCGDALYYFYLDGNFNARFNLNDVRVEGNRYVYENQSGNYNYFPGYPYADPDVAAYVDTLIEDDNADIWCEQNGDTFNVGFVDGNSRNGATIAELKTDFDAAAYEIRKLEGLA